MLGWHSSRSTVLQWFCRNLFLFRSAVHGEGGTCGVWFSEPAKKEFEGSARKLIAFIYCTPHRGLSIRSGIVYGESTVAHGPVNYCLN
jgi:hypothetical protein